MTIAIIVKAMQGNFGLAKKKWIEQLIAIRALPETPCG